MIEKRGNRWWVVVYAGRDPLTGRKRQKTYENGTTNYGPQHDRRHPKEQAVS